MIDPALAQIDCHDFLAIRNRMHMHVGLSQLKVPSDPDSVGFVGNGEIAGPEQSGPNTVVSRKSAESGKWQIFVRTSLGLVALQQSISEVRHQSM